MVKGAAHHNICSIKVNRVFKVQRTVILDISVRCTLKTRVIKMLQILRSSAAVKI